MLKPQEPPNIDALIASRTLIALGAQEPQPFRIGDEVRSKWRYDNPWIGIVTDVQWSWHIDVIRPHYLMSMESKKMCKTTLTLALTLALTACGMETEETPAPEPVAYETVSLPLVADGPPTVTGGTLVNRVFRNAQSYESCLDPTPPHCVSYQASLPTVPSGMEIWVAPIVPIVSIVGQPVSYSPPDKPPCVEPMLAELTYSTDAWIWPRSLPGSQVAMEKGATRLTVSLCFRGEVRAQLGDLTGTVSYARYQPLHR